MIDIKKKTKFLNRELNQSLVSVKELLQNKYQYFELKFNSYSKHILVSVVK